MIRLEAGAGGGGSPSPALMEISKYSAVSIIPQLRQNITPLMWLGIIMISPRLSSTTTVSSQDQTPDKPVTKFAVVCSYQSPQASRILN